MARISADGPGDARSDLRQVVVRAYAWERTLAGICRRSLAPLLWIVVAFWAVGPVTSICGIGYTHGWQVVETGIVGTIVLWWVAYGLAAFTTWQRRREVEHTLDAGVRNRVIWISGRAWTDDEVQQARNRDFEWLVLPYPRLLRKASEEVLLSLVLLVFTCGVLASWAMGFGLKSSTFGAGAFAVVLYCIQRWVFPDRLRLAPGRLELVESSRITGTAKVCKVAPLRAAQVVIWADDPARVDIQWDGAVRREQLRLRHLPPEACAFVWLAAMTTCDEPDMPVPRLGDVLRGYKRQGPASKSRRG